MIYRRHDPIQPPRLRASGAVRAGRGHRPARDPQRPGPGPPGQLHAIDRDYPLAETRTLDPPIASLQLIEQHGMLDAG